MKNIIIFTNSDFGSIRAYESEGHLYFNAYDVAKCLKFENPEYEVTTHCENPIVSICQSLEEVKKWVYIHESNLYKLVSYAKDTYLFEKWINKEVIPSIRVRNRYTKEEFLENINYLI